MTVTSIRASAGAVRASAAVAARIMHQRVRIRSSQGRTRTGDPPTPAGGACHVRATAALPRRRSGSFVRGLRRRGRTVDRGDGQRRAGAGDSATAVPVVVREAVEVLTGVLDRQPYVVGGGF